MSELSVVICAQRRPALLGECLAALAAQTRPAAEFEVVLVLSAATREVRETARAWRERGALRLLVIDEPHPGLSRARNRGLFAGRGEVLAFTDDDTRPGPGWLAALAAAFARDQRVLGVFGSTRGPAGTPFPLCEKTDPAPAEIANTHDLWLIGHGNNMAFRRRAFTLLGVFDETLGAGSATRAGEDIDFAYRVLKSGWRLRYEPAAFVEHAPPLAEAGPHERLRGYDLGALAFALKHLAAGDALPAALVYERLRPRLRIIRPYLPFSPRALWRDQHHELGRLLAMLRAAGPLLWRYTRRRGENE